MDNKLTTKNLLSTFIPSATQSTDRQLSKAYHAISILFKGMGFFKTITTEVPTDEQGNAIPWYTYPAQDYLRHLDFSTASFLEFGSGYSTLYWEENVKSLLSVERDLSWYNKISTLITKSNTKVVLKTEFNEYSAFIKEISSLKFDVIIIDGRDRFYTASQVLPMLSETGMLIFDNSDWYPKSCQLLREAGLFQIDFCGFGPINNYTWCTSIFLKKNIHFQHKSQISFVGKNDVIKEDDSIL